MYTCNVTNNNNNKNKKMKKNAEVNDELTMMFLSYIVSVFPDHTHGIYWRAMSF